MTSKRVQDLLEANNRLLTRAREAEEKLAQAPEEAKKRLEAISIITSLRNCIGPLIHGNDAAGAPVEHEINSLLVSLAGKFERFIGLPKTEDEAKSMISVGLAYLNGMGGDHEERVMMMPRDEYEREVYEAFQAGWFTNSVRPGDEGVSYTQQGLEECALVDFEAYQDLGLTIYLDQLQPIKEEFGAQEDPKTWADKWARKVDELAQQPADNDSAVVNTMPREVTVMKIDPQALYTSKEPVALIGDELSMTHLHVGPVKIDLISGNVILPEGISSYMAARMFWDSVEAYILHSRQPLPRVKHLKRGATYEILGDGEVQISVPQVVRNFANDYIDNARILKEGMKLRVYRDEEAGKLWLRFPDEFDDGRFETIR